MTVMSEYCRKLSCFLSLLPIVACAFEINDGWRLAMDPANIGKTNGWASTVRPDARPVPVPGVIQQVFPHECGVAWYTRRLARPEAQASERILLRFGAVDYSCEVFLDGHLVGSHEGAEDPFEFDVTGLLKADSLLAVRVINPGETPIEGFTCKTVPHRNKFEKMEFRPGWCYNTGGITLPVSLDVVPEVRVTDAFVRADWKTGSVEVETTVVNDAKVACEREITFTVRLDDTPRPVCSLVTRRTLEAGTNTFVQSFAVPGFKLWDLDSPNVYQLTVGDFATRFGFRDFRLEKGWFHLNGRRIFLKSAHTGNHLPGGLAVVDPRTPELEFRDFQNMKAMGFNCVRFIATQATPRQLDYCDRLGLMVYQETYASWCLADSPHAKRRFLDSLRAELKRDRNHPSITIWGAINEMRQGDANAAARDMLPELRPLDPTRLWIYSSGRWDLWPKRPANAKGGGYQPPGQPGPDWSVGSASNPGSMRWDCVWGEDGVVANNEAPNPGKTGLSPVCGDLHFYPGYPHDAESVRKLRTWSANARPAFISEYGVGSLLDVIDHCHEFERRGIPSTSPDYERMAEIRDRYLADWKALGLSRFFADPVDFLRDSERFNARSRREGFDLVRSNSRFVGYNLTGALDHAICGEGPMSLFRRVKDGNFDVFRDGWNDLRWCLFLSRGNYFTGDAVSFEAVLADFDSLRDGAYQASFAIVDATGTVKWRSSSIPFPVPSMDADGLRKVAYPITNQRAEVVLEPGCYSLRAYLNHGGYVAASEKSFFVTARPATETASDFIELDWVDETVGIAAMKRVEEGVTALVHLEKWGTRPPKFLPLKNLSVKPRNHWLYHDDTLVVPNPLTKGLKTGFLDWDFFDGCFPRFGFNSDTEPESFAAVDFDVGGPQVYSRTFSLAVYHHGKGRLIVSTMPLDPSSPAGATILANARRR